MKLRNSLTKKLLVAILTISSVVTAFITVFQLRFDFLTEMAAVDAHLKLIEDSYLSSISSSVWNLDEHQVKVQLEGMLKIPGIDYVELRDAEGQTITFGRQDRQHFLSKTFPLKYLNYKNLVPVGSLQVVVDLDNIYNKIFQKVFVIFFSQLFKTLAVMSICFFLIQHMLTKHLIKASVYLNGIDFENPSPDLALARAPSSEEGKDELDVLVQNINKMKGSLATSYQSLKGFASTLESRVEEKTQLIHEQNMKLSQAAKLSALGEMAGGVAHEINNPLAIINMLASQVQEILAAESIDRNLAASKMNKLANTTARIAKIVQGLRTFSRDGSKDQFQTVNVRVLVEETISFCNERLISHGIILECQSIPADLYFEGRSTEISQVLLNLLNNAYDAIQDQKEKWVKISVSDSTDSLEVRVTDSGSGISPDVVKKMYQPFFTTKEIGKGTGLGLSLAIGIVQNHRGKLFLDSENKNTCFVIFLPKVQIGQKAA